jgi:galactonate dehydratase
VKIAALETFLTHAGLRNYLFVRLRTEDGLTGIGEASLEWQERAVQVLLEDWVRGRVLGRDPFDMEAVIGGLIRDQYQGGSTVMTAISAVEVACWDLIGKACHQPVYRLLGGRCHPRIRAYANGWYGGAETPADYAERARDVVRRGYRAMKFDPFGVGWKHAEAAEAEEAVAIIAAVREAAGPEVDLMIEFHGRFAYPTALGLMRRIAKYRPAWCEEPLVPEQVELLVDLKRETGLPVAAGERLYTVPDFYRLCSNRAADVVQLDPAHCGGLSIAKKVAAIADVRDLRIAPHCSIGPVALAACLHFDISTPNFYIQEAFGEFDVPWRDALVAGWNPLREGEFVLSDKPGLGLELDERVIAEHPYRPDPFPSLWDRQWVSKFTQMAGSEVTEGTEDR